MPALFAVVSTCLSKEPATQLFFPVCSVELQNHPWCLPFLLWCQLANQRNLPSNSRKSRILNTPIQSVLIMSVPLHLLWSWIHNSTLMHPLYIPDKWLETCGRCYTCMKLDSLWWLDAWVWADSNESWTCGRCSGVMWPMNCFGRSRCHLIYITQEIRNHRTGQPINQ